LESISVNTDGIISGRYSNGVVRPLFQLALADFQNVHGLHSHGANLFSQTRQSGHPVTGAPGTQGLGAIAPNSLEHANVDMAKELVNTITNQRGYEANLKMLRTTDEMLESVIDLFS
jgi:flagellar hook protein FlgE